MLLIDCILLGREGDYEIWEESWHMEHGIQKYTIAVLAPEVRAALGPVVRMSGVSEYNK